MTTSPIIEYAGRMIDNREATVTAVNDLMWDQYNGAMNNIIADLELGRGMNYYHINTAVEAVGALGEAARERDIGYGYAQDKVLNALTELRQRLLRGGPVRDHIPR